MNFPRPNGMTDRVGDILVTHRSLTQAQAQEAAEYAESTGLRFGEAAVALGMIDQDTLRETLNLHFALSRTAAGSVVSNPLPIALSTAASAHAADCRVLRNQLALRLKLPRSNAPAVAIVGAADDAGGSTVAAHLAISFAGVGYRTLLIDGDVERPRQQELFHLTSEGGLANYLEGGAASPLLLSVPGIDHLTVLPAGSSLVSAGDLFLRTHLHRLVNAAQLMFDIILIDTPAAARGREYLLLAAECGNALLVTREGLTKRRAVRAVAAECAEAGIAMIGATMVGRNV